MEEKTPDLTVTIDFMKADVPSINGRIYPKAVVEAMIAKFNEDKAAGKTMLGIVGYSTSAHTELSEVSHVVEALEMKEDGTVAVTARVIDTPNGRIVKNMAQKGEKLKAGPRGSGKLEKKENGYEVSDYHFDAIDFIRDGGWDL